MNQEVCLKLCEVVEILQSQGDTSLDYRKVKALLLDLCGKHRREINLLLLTLSEGFVTELLSESHFDILAAIRAAATMLGENYAIDDSAALWAMSTWAAALNKMPLDSTNIATPPSQHQQPNTQTRTLATHQSAPEHWPKPGATVSQNGPASYRSIDDAVRAGSRGSILVGEGDYSCGFNARSGTVCLLANRSAQNIRLDMTLWSGRLNLWGFTNLRLELTTSYRDALSCENCRIDRIVCRSSGSIKLEKCELGHVDHAGKSDFQAVNCTFTNSNVLLRDCSLSSPPRSFYPPKHVQQQKNAAPPTSVTLRHCTFERAFLEITGEGVVELSSCRITDNPGISICVTNNGSAKLDKCHIANNGVGVDVVKGTAALTQCKFTGNDIPARFSSNSGGEVADCNFKMNKQQLSISPSSRVQSGHKSL